MSHFLTMADPRTRVEAVSYSFDIEAKTIKGLGEIAAEKAAKFYDDQPFRRALSNFSKATMKSGSAARWQR